MEDKDHGERRDQLLTDTLLRISSLEKLLISKSIVTEKEVADSFLTAANKLLEIMAAQLSSEQEPE